MKKREGFNTPFAVFKELKKKSEPAKPTRAPQPPPQRKASASSDAESEAELFLMAMGGVEKLPNRGQPPVPPARLPKIVNDDAEALAQLAELVSGQGRFDIADSDEYIEGAGAEVDKRLLLALRNGDFAVQGHLDLHGMTRQQARDAVEKFLHESRLGGKRCVLLVHGRGLNSKDQIPVLKEALQVWLARGRIAKDVLAFATARPHDGGAGALYVLLRQRAAPGH